jgi:LuxR family maltose regulon positive regulatory protein
LAELLARGREAAVTLVSAPAGFGKTTLLTEWLADDPATAWLSLDPQDSDPARFWGYVIAAVDRAAPGTGTAAAALLAAQSPTDTVLATLLNDLDALADDVVLVLDDHHVIESIDIHQGLDFLVEHLPPHVHLVIATRVDPPLPLARLRAQGDLVEVRAADLRFTAEEAAAYLNGTMGLTLTADDVAALEARTEGWIAALQLAALSMQGRDDVADFVAGFAGDDRYVVDYLVGEVLARQPDEVRGFLLKTSVLSRLSGPLCDAVTGAAGGQATLEELERANLFLVRLDDRRQWYRYHHLFADVLRARLADEQPELVPELHRRAGEWYEADGDRAEALRHAMAVGDVGRASDLIEQAAPDLRRARQEATLNAWIEALPHEAFTDRPILAIERVGSLMGVGDVDGVERWLREVEQMLESSTMVVADAAAVDRIPASIAMYRAGLARIRGDGPATVAHADEAIRRSLEDDHLVRAAATTLRGLAQWADGDLDTAHESYEQGLVEMERAGHLADMLGLAVGLADIQRAQGRLSAAVQTFERGLGLGTADDGAPLRGTADMHVGLVELFLDRNDLDAARHHLDAARELGEAHGLEQNPHRWRMAAARLREVDGDLDGALALLDEAARVHNSDFLPDVRPIAAVRARVQVRRGEVDEAAAWARPLSVDDDLSYQHEFAHVTLARILLAQGDDRAGPFLDRLLAAAEAGGRTGSVIELLVLKAQARRGAEAQAHLEQAHALAEPEGFVRVFLDEESHDEQPPSRPVPQPGLVEPLSERELDVLRLLKSELSGPDIARELYVSLNTLRTHTRHIYEKLGVSGRRAAVRRADELGL